MASIGRLKYVEPTGDSDNAITHPYEDYCMSVDLTVQIANRYCCGFPDETGLIEEMKFSSSNGTISFLGGTNGMLTTNFTDISMTDPSSNTSECLGIESISISYDNRMYPQVVIKFIDVRGATVMSKAEQNYYNEGSSSTKKLYKSLFTFPYPMFTLTVKGFYGKGATYKLAVSKSDIELDSETGNFVLTVSFIGYMYGIYTDIPLTYIAAAPFMPGGAEYWAEQKRNKRFRFKDGYGNPSSEMLDFTELRLRVAQASMNERVTSIRDEGQKSAANNDEAITLLKNALDNYPFKTGNGWIIGKYCFYKVVENEDKVVEIRNALKEYSDNLKAFDKQHSTEFAKFIINEANIYDGADTKLYSTKYIANTTNGSWEATDAIDGNYTDRKRREDKDINDAIHKEIGKNTNSCYVFYMTKEDIFWTDEQRSKKITKKIQELKEKRSELEKDYKKKELVEVENILQFKPSVKNIYDLIFAHMETFMHCFYEGQNKIILDQLLDQHNFRKKEYQLTSDDTDTDKKSNFLPPYTAYYQTTTIANNAKKRDVVWPLEICKHGEELEEVKFVRALINGAESLYKQNETVDELINKMRTAEESTEGGEGEHSSSTETSFDSSTIVDTRYFLPLTTYDLMNKGNVSNPYTTIGSKLKQDATEIIENDIIGVFALRAFSFLATLDYHGIPSAKLFGKLEAINFYKAVGAINSSALKNFILKYKDKADDFINNITDNNKQWLNGTTKSLFVKQNNNITYNLDKVYFPIGIFDFTKISDDYLEPNLLSNNLSYLNLNPENAHENHFKIIEERNYLNGIDASIEAELSSYNITEFKKHSECYEKIEDNQALIADDVVYKSEGNNFNPISDEAAHDLLREASEDELNVYYILRPTKVDEENKQSLFVNNLYKLQTDISAKAYLFLQGLPIKPNKDHGGILFRNKSGIYAKALLLREGSYYWYKDNYEKVITEGTLPNTSNKITYKRPATGEPFIINNKRPATDESFIVNNNTFVKYENINPLLSTSNDKYAVWNYPKNCTPSRINKLKKYFEDWAAEFGKYEEYLHNEKYFDSSNNLLRTDLLTKETTEGKNARNLQKFLRDLFFKPVTIFDLHGVELNRIDASETIIKASFEGFISQLDVLYINSVAEGEETGATTNSATMDETSTIEQPRAPFENKDVSLSTYLTLKGLYDKWLCSPPNNTWKTWTLENDDSFVESDFKNFKYVDTFFHDIGYVFTLNVTKLADYLSSYLPTSNTNTSEGIFNYTGKSVYNLLNELAQDSGAMLIAMPQKIGNYGNINIDELFKPYSLYGDWANEDMSYVFMYTYKPSEHLGDTGDNAVDMNGWNADGDGVDLTNDDDAKMLFDDEGYQIPAFGVTYAKQNQSIFKNIRLNTSDAGVTEASLAATNNIASKVSEGPRESMLFGQDLYRVFNQYSYKCSVETMGNAQIMPLMYFQLNNIPLWKGGYQILKVRHEISAGDFKTTFDGVRINRNAIPLNQGDVMFLDGLGLGSGEDSSNYNFSSIDFTEGIKSSEKYQKITYIPPRYGKNEYSGRIHGRANGVECIVKDANRTKFLNSHGIAGKITEKQMQEMMVWCSYTLPNGEKTSVLVHKNFADDVQKVLNKLSTYKINMALGSFCFRNVSGTNSFSMHAFGMAIDINPGSNPYHITARKSHPNDKPSSTLNTARPTDTKGNFVSNYANITKNNASNTLVFDDVQKGIICTYAHIIVKAFAEIGWGWGGRYYDYMHFSAYNGN